MGRSLATRSGLSASPITVVERAQSGPITTPRYLGLAAQGMLAQPVQDQEREDGGGAANPGEHTAGAVF